MALLVQSATFAPVGQALARLVLPIAVSTYLVVAIDISAGIE